MLIVNNIEVIYDDVILVLKGLSLEVHDLGHPIFPVSLQKDGGQGLAHMINLF